MSAPVDVLAVMDAAINLRAAIYNDGRGSSCSDVTANRKANLDDAIAARAAIAELIEAAEWMSDYFHADSGVDRVIRLRAALSAVSPK